MFMPDEEPSPPEACDVCGHSLMLHDDEGCLVATCGCDEPDD